jgi:hypothetical protein
MPVLRFQPIAGPLALLRADNRHRRNKRQTAARPLSPAKAAAFAPLAKSAGIQAVCDVKLPAEVLSGSGQSARAALVVQIAQ